MTQILDLIFSFHICYSLFLLVLLLFLAALMRNQSALVFIIKEWKGNIKKLILSSRQDMGNAKEGRHKPIFPLFFSTSPTLVLTGI
jgi:hypothetical protein